MQMWKNCIDFYSPPLTLPPSPQHTEIMLHKLHTGYCIWTLVKPAVVDVLLLHCAPLMNMYMYIHTCTYSDLHKI